jgi:hypothetical protein
MHPTIEPHWNVLEIGVHEAHVAYCEKKNRVCDPPDHNVMNPVWNQPCPDPEPANITQAAETLEELMDPEHRGPARTTMFAFTPSCPPPLVVPDAPAK